MEVWNPECYELYLRRRSMFQKKLDRVKKKANRISWLRLLSFTLAVFAFGYGLYGPYAGIIYMTIPLAALFGLLVIKHNRLKEEINFLQKLVKINDTARLRLEGKWTAFTERGGRYVDHNHPYTTDLNIFGEGSLFQYINATSSFRGERILAGLLSGPSAAEKIRLRQEAVSDLAARLDFRQYLQAAGMDSFFKEQDPDVIVSWAKRQEYFFRQPGVLLFLPLVTCSVFALGLLGIVSYLPAALLLALQVAIASPGEKKAREHFARVEKAVQRLKRYEKLLCLIEQENFKAPYLIAQKKRLYSGGRFASRQVRLLVNISDRNNLRFSNSMIYLILKFAVFWDLWTLKLLDDWQKKCGLSVCSWFDAAGEVEALSSLAGLYHDNPHWAFANILDGPPTFQAEGLGHPLIAPAERVSNDLAISGPGTFFMITGSNMSGKSTLLRTVGINLVLAYAGAPVCAAKLKCSIMQMYSKMHILDNLEERISTFYAELLRMKMIIDAAVQGTPLLILLDEIFRGTNPQDRIFATRIIIKQLQRLNTVGLVTTHDLELGKLEKEYPGSICNYHFTDEIRDGSIFFDYKIKPGIARTANALSLMKLIGIDVEAE